MPGERWVERRWTRPVLQAALAVGVAVVAWWLAGVLGRESLESAWAQHRSGGWPAADGQVVSSAFWPVPRTPGQVTRINVEYQYTVGGRTLTAKTLRLVDFVPESEARQRQVVAGLPVGASVRVFYDPAQPTRAVLEPGLRAGDVWLVVAAMIGLSGTAAFTLLAVTHLRRLGRPTVGGLAMRMTPRPMLEMDMYGPAPKALGVAAAVGYVMMHGWVPFAEPRPLVGMAVILACMAGGLLVGWWFWRRRVSPEAGWLVVDPVEREIRVNEPTGVTRRWPFEAVATVAVDPRQMTSDGDADVRGKLLWVIPYEGCGEPRVLVERPKAGETLAVRGWVLELMGREAVSWQRELAEGRL